MWYGVVRYGVLCCAVLCCAVASVWCSTVVCQAVQQQARSASVRIFFLCSGLPEWVPVLYSTRMLLRNGCAEVPILLRFVAVYD